ncbi:hypothetical protein swp_1145 [Shewanella piezotolerans WP3]|uniref:Uncharacterized protein n=1 Tax=Shewanella piezotolerans (strain WP3 / JCM 13877) TaxID=225849 RepID=B8CKA4_SHEPW|nr:hypothetical protein swp_1145 [Shewanella piezotolerans WP3]
MAGVAVLMHPSGDIPVKKHDAKYGERYCGKIQPNMSSSTHI